MIGDDRDYRAPGMVMAAFDLDMAARDGAAFGFFCDRRPELYGRLAQDI